jgi:putative oxidoreductase
MSVNLGLLLVRLLIGAGFAAHGAQILFGAFHGAGLAGTADAFEPLGLRPGRRYALLAGFGQLGGGLLLLLGFLTPLAATLIISSMIVATFTVHIKNGFFGQNNGFEIPYLYSSAALGFAVGGAGAYSLDRLFGLDFVNRPGFVLACLALAVAGGVGTLAMRKPPAAAQPQASGEAERRKAA